MSSFSPSSPSPSAALAAPRVLADLLPGRAAAAASTAVREVALVVGGAALTGLAAQVAIPLPGTPVPMTLQTFAVLVVGAALGWRRGLASLAFYALAGLAGVPWFAEHSSGWAMASSGYILGFVFAAALVGWLAQRGADRCPLTTAAAMVAGNVVIYACGVTVLTATLDTSVAHGIELGLVPFLLADLVKIVLAAGMLPLVWAVVGRRRA